MTINSKFTGRLLGTEERAPFFAAVVYALHVWECVSVCYAMWCTVHTCYTYRLTVRKGALYGAVPPPP